MERNKIIVKLIFALIPLGMVIFYIFYKIYGPSNRVLMNERVLSEKVKGVVDTVYNDEQNHNVRTAILKDKSVYYILPEWESYIEKDDSLYKKEGSFFLEIYKKNRSKIILDYKLTLPHK